MNARGCADVRHELGAYVLDGLDEAAASEVERHLGICEACRGEHATIAGTPALLALAREAPPPVPARVRDRVLADAVRRRWRTSWMVAAAGLALVAGTLGGVLGWWLAPDDPVRVAVPLEAVEPSEASGWASFRSEEGRLVVDLDLDGLEPLAEPAIYEAWVSRVEGGIHSIGQLAPDQDGGATVTLSADGAPEDYQGFWITAEPDGRDPAHEGPTVLRSPIPPPD